MNPQPYRERSSSYYNDTKKPKHTTSCKMNSRYNSRTKKRK